MSAMKIYKELPPWAKGVAVVGTIAIVYFTAKSFLGRVKKQAEMKANLQESTVASAELAELKRQGINPTLQPSMIQSIITSLMDAMDGCGTNESRVYENFRKLNNIADLQLLIKTWGVRYYRPCAASQPVSYAKWLWDNKAFGGSLSTWLNYELTSSEISKINDIFASKGINYKF